MLSCPIRVTPLTRVSSILSSINPSKQANIKINFKSVCVLPLAAIPTYYSFGNTSRSLAYKSLHTSQLLSVGQTVSSRQVNQQDAIKKQNPVSILYNEKVKKGILNYDKCQENTLARLDPLSPLITEYEAEYLRLGFPEKKSISTPGESTTSGICGLWNRLKTTMTSSLNSTSRSAANDSLPPPKGFYMYGDVGSGKTMLMDLFLEATPLKYKHRVHFNSFMIEFHNSLHEWRQSPESKGQAQTAAIEKMADKILKKSPLLCFDEFQVTNIADAMILNRLFNILWQKGAVVIATSNRVPDELYKGGLQRENFVPFIGRLKDKCFVHDIGSTIDYRLIGERAHEIFLVKGKSLTSAEDVWDRLTEKRAGEPMELTLNSRKIVVPKAIKGIAKFSFPDLCAKPLGAADYGLIAREFHTLILTDLPIMNLDQKDLVRRFITLVDELYEHRVKLICSAEAEMEAIFPLKLEKSTKSSSSSLLAGEEEIFAFSRTLSRLHEMQTTEYLQSHHLKDPSIRPSL